MDHQLIVELQRKPRVLELYLDQSKNSQIDKSIVAHYEQVYHIVGTSACCEGNNHHNLFHLSENADHDYAKEVERVAAMNQKRQKQRY